MGQLRGMYEGDRSRKLALIDAGFRLPSALDNRPLQLPEFLERVDANALSTATVAWSPKMPPPPYVFSFTRISMTSYGAADATSRSVRLSSVRT